MRSVTQAVMAMVLDTPSIMTILSESTGEGVPPAEDRVFVNRVPKELIEAVDPLHPPKILVIRMAGGSAKADFLPIDQSQITILCYGESDYEADRVRRAAWDRLMFMQREKHDGTLIHHVNSTGGVTPLVDPDIVWPAVAQSYTLTADVLDAA